GGQCTGRQQGGQAQGQEEAGVLEDGRFHVRGPVQCRCRLRRYRSTPPPLTRRGRPASAIRQRSGPAKTTLASGLSRVPAGKRDAASSARPLGQRRYLPPETTGRGTDARTGRTG